LFINKSSEGYLLFPKTHGKIKKGSTRGAEVVRQHTLSAKFLKRIGFNRFDFLEYLVGEEGKKKVERELAEMRKPKKKEKPKTQVIKQEVLHAMSNSTEKHIEKAEKEVNEAVGSIKKKESPKLEEFITDPDISEFAQFGYFPDERTTTIHEGRHKIKISQNTGYVVITPETLQKMNKIYEKYKDILKNGEQAPENGSL
jgi:hypothetical protein